MSEKNDYQTLRLHVRMMRDRMDRMENGVGVGMPDVNYCIEGVEGWIEIKSPTEPVRPSTPLFGSNHKLSQNQKNWFLLQRRAGGIAWVLICTNKRWMLIEGAHADDVNTLTVEQLRGIAAWHASKYLLGPTNWTVLRGLLSLRP